MIIEEIDPQNKLQAETYVSWYSNPTMLKNWILQKEDSLKVTEYTIGKFQDDFSNPDKIAFMIKVDDMYIGYGSFFINHPVCMYKEGKVCWPSIGIGNDKYRGQGIGVQLCKQIVKLAIAKNCTHIEAGIFEFNNSMRKILLRNGFKLIGKRKNITFADNQWWDSGQYLLEIKELIKTSKN